MATRAEMVNTSLCRHTHVYSVDSECSEKCLALFFLLVDLSKKMTSLLQIRNMYHNAVIKINIFNYHYIKFAGFVLKVM
ncbi:hypothetical protein QTP88_008619 [Uroleucon formosanum]